MSATHQYDQEVRIAVVMYGGVSLAIYMNGITQELLHLVRATAPDPDGSGKLLHQTPDGTEAVYRDLARMLHAGNGALDATLAGDAHPVRSRFVIDILTGTSAGGINAIFLSKALTLDQSLDGVRQLWLAEAGIEKLINDKYSLMKALKTQRPPESLLNGERMYLQLLEAFDMMDRAGRRDPSPYVDDALDLYVTATDIVGLGLPLRLQYQQVEERRHKNIFHFAYRAMPDGRQAPLASAAWPITSELRKGTNHFAETNPVLAFAGRCTSSFPFAFEPMTLERAESLCRAAGRSVDMKTMARPFFEDYLQAAAFNPAGNPVPFDKIPFGDGGYLDNKPFGHAISALGARASSLPGIRKLVYVEPSPEQIVPSADTKLTFIDNVMAAAFTLPAYETIREDVQRINERNRIVERIRRINAFVEDDLAHWRPANDAYLIPMDPLDWRVSTAAQMVARYGPAYGGYQRLRVSSTSDELASLITRAMGLNRTSNNYLAIRELVRAWRNLNYPDDEPGDHTFNAFLYKFDLPYLIRRLALLRARINEMTAADYWSEQLCSKLDPTVFPAGQASDPGFRTDFAAELMRLKAEFAYLSRRLERDAERLAEEGGPVARALAGDDQAPEGDPRRLGIDERILAMLREEPTEESLQRAAQDLVKNLRADLRAADERMAAAVKSIVTSYQAAYDRVRASADPDATQKTGEKSARIIANRLYDSFEKYDFLSFPVLAMTDVGEPVRADVIRISPLEPSSLGGEQGNPRLAGMKLFHFGAFLERHWRENDMLWGRLQAAEQLISAFVPRQPNEAAARTSARKDLVDRAHIAIFKDLIRSTSVDVVGGLVKRTAAQVEAAKQAGLTPPPLDMVRLRQLFECTFTPEGLRDHYKAAFVLDETVSPPSALQAASRSSVVIGQMLEGASTRLQPVSAWIIRAGRTVWGAVEVSVPGSLWSRVFAHWSRVLLIVAALMIILGTLADIPQAPRVGWLVLLVVFAAVTVSTLFRWYFEHRFPRLKFAAMVLGVLTVVLAAFGAVDLSHRIVAVITRLLS